MFLYFVFDSGDDYDIGDKDSCLQALDAFKRWKKTTSKERASVLRKIGDLVLENKVAMSIMMIKLMTMVKEMIMMSFLLANHNDADDDKIGKSDSTKCL